MVHRIDSLLLPEARACPGRFKAGVNVHVERHLVDLGCNTAGEHERKVRTDQAMVVRDANERLVMHPGSGVRDDNRFDRHAV
jgi:hypothetical protein